MTNQEKVQFLSGYTLLGKEVDRLAQEICLWEKRKDALCPFSEPHYETDGQNEELSKRQQEIGRLQKQLQKKIRDMLFLRRKIDRAIQGLENDTQRLLCSLRYLDGLTWEEVAEKMFYSVQHVHKIHVKALSHMELDPKKKR